VYPLITYAGALTGGLANLTLVGNFVQPVALTNPPGMIALVATVPPAPPNAPSDLTALPLGAFQVNLSWTDNATDEVGLVVERAVGSPTGFNPVASLPADTMAYEDLGLTPDTTYFYRVAATNLAGAAYSNTNSTTTGVLPPLLTWRGDGAANGWDVVGSPNWFDGSTLVVYNDTTDVLFDDSGTNNTPVSLVGTLQPDSVTVSASKNYAFSGTGTLAGGMSLTKSGPGTLALANAAGNSFTGGVIVEEGTLIMGAANTIGAGPVTLRSNSTLVLGTLSLSSANPLTIEGTPSLTGGHNGGLTDLYAVNGDGVVAVAVTTGVLDLQGSLAGFHGTFAFNSGNTVRFYGSTGGATTTFDLGGGNLNLNKRSSTGTIILGALAGGSNTTLQGSSGSGNTTATTYSIGGKNINAVFEGTIINGQGPTGITKVGSGTQTLWGGNTYTGLTTVSAGTLVINGNQTAATGDVVVGPLGTLGGSGTVGGDTYVDGTLAPGQSVGTLTCNGDLILNPSSTARFEISLNPTLNDLAVVSGALALDGTLQVVNVGIELPALGDVFQLFSAPTFSGAFAAFDLPALDEGLAWSTTRLATDGTLWVVSTVPPAFNSMVLDAGDLVLQGAGGTPNWDYFVLSTTNLLVPSSGWTAIQTNQFDVDGHFEFSVPLDPATPQRYFRLELP